MTTDLLIAAHKRGRRIRIGAARRDEPADLLLLCWAYTLLGRLERLRHERHDASL